MFRRFIFTMPANGWIYDTKNTDVKRLFKYGPDPTPIQFLRTLDKLNNVTSYDYEEIPKSVFDGDQCCIDGELILVYKTDPEFDYHFVVREEYDKELVAKIPKILSFVCALRKYWRKMVVYDPRPDPGPVWVLRRSTTTTIVDTRRLPFLRAPSEQRSSALHEETAAPG